MRKSQFIRPGRHAAGFPKWIFLTACWLSPVIFAHAEDTNLVDQVQALREQNALLQQQVKQQGEQINALSRQFKDLQAVQASENGNDKATPEKTGLLNKVIIGGEGGAGYNLTQPKGFAPDGKFQLNDA